MITAPNWTSLAWRGFASVMFGIVALAWPGVTLGALTLLFGAYALADGVLALFVAMTRGRRRHRWLLVVDGLIGIGAGVLTFLWPGLTLLVLILMVGVRALLMGGAQIAAAVALRKSIPTSAVFLYALGGLCSIGLGIVAFAVPGITALVLVTMLAVYSLIFGGVVLALSIALWRESRRALPHDAGIHAPAR
jgi:uncharacterized membrane protein HdeD (DUF308 family)